MHQLARLWALYVCAIAHLGCLSYRTEIMMIGITAWSGTVLYLASYSLVAFGLLEAGGLYMSLNAVAAEMVMVASVAKGAWAVFALNATWATLSIRACVAAPLRLPPFSVSVYRWGLLIFFLTSMSLLFLSSPARALEALAWCSFLAYIISYLLLLSKQIGLFEFQLWNLFAATIIVPSLYVSQSWAFVTIQLFWMAVSIVGLFRDTFIRWRQQSWTVQSNRRR